jgi:hypothetical protein
MLNAAHVIFAVQASNCCFQQKKTSRHLGLFFAEGAVKNGLEADSNRRPESAKLSP